MSHKKLTLMDALLINLNIMLGAGVLVNSVVLTQSVGVYSSLSYILVGIFMAPLIASVAKLSQMYPSGGFYAYAYPTSPFLAFLSAWSYFFGKLASTSLILLVASTFLLQLFPTLALYFSPLLMALCILSCFVTLNVLNLKIHQKVQIAFFVAKSIPPLFVIISAIALYHSITVPVPAITPIDMAISFPFILYSFTGFEAACAISRNIINPEKNAAKAIFYSFFFITGIYAVFQLSIAVLLSQNISSIASYKEAFPYITQLWNMSPSHTQSISSLLSCVISFATLGGAYGIIFSNAWNLYTLAEHKLIPASNTLIILNGQRTPIYAIIVEGLAVTAFILLTQADQIILQQTAAFGITLAYAISCYALIRLQSSFSIAPYAGIMTCVGLLGASFMSLTKYGVLSLAPSIFITAIGCMVYTLYSCKK